MDIYARLRQMELMADLMKQNIELIRKDLELTHDPPIKKCIILI